MPAEHSTDHSAKIITTIWSGEATDSALLDALQKYQETFAGHAYRGYNEIVDFGAAGSFKLTVAGIRSIAQLAVKTDVDGARSKLAVVVSQPVAYGLGRMYETYRSLLPGGKDVSVFKSYAEALRWIEEP